jgi:phenylalanyl-tRNA synthetase beta chain
MKLSPNWIRDFVDLKVDDRQLATDLTAAGIAVEGMAGERENTVFEMEIGTNRPDAMNHYGVAREASAIYNSPLKPIAPKLSDARGAADFPIEIQDVAGCARFTARIACDVKIAPSPAQIARRLALIDQRPINNAVDTTNYTLWEVGKPTHAFDLDLLEGGKIIVRRAADGEKLKTLDGIERKLTAEDLVVADAKKPVGLAGVMGGYDTMITDKTRNVLIESAWWDPATVRKMARRHGIHTDASHRFERGADFESTVLSCNRVLELLFESGGGYLQGNAVDVIARPLDQAPVALHISEVHRILGQKLATQVIYGLLHRLGFELIPERGGEFDFTVRIPSWRLDVEREIDLVEEVARLYGYDKFPNTLPAFAGAVVDQPETKKDEKLRSLLLGLGYDEAVSLSFISHEDAETFSNAPVIELANPISEEASIMRTSMLPGMLNMLAYNLNRGTDDVRLFEMGTVFENQNAGMPREPKRICLGRTCPTSEKAETWPGQPFFTVKGDIEILLHTFEHKTLSYDSQAGEYFHPGRAARAVMDGSTVAQFGQIHPDIAAKRKLRQEVYIAELYLDQLYSRGLREIRYEALPRYPAVQRDFSFVFPDDVMFAQIEKAVSSLELPELRGSKPVEIFRGGKLPAGKYSILLRATFQSKDRTLREDEVAERSKRIVKSLEKLGGEQRA